MIGKRVNIFLEKEEKGKKSPYTISLQLELF